jgi:hypothetical protein
MKQALRNYSHVLQLRTEAVRSVLDNFDAAYALKLLVIVGLIAGLGVLAGIPHALQELTLPEQIDQAVSAARTATAEVAAVVMPALTNAQSATEAVVAVIQEQVAGITEQINSVVAGVTSVVNSGRAQVDTQVAQLQQNSQVQQLLTQTTVTAAQVEQAISQAPATAEQISALLTRANVTPEQATALLQRAGVAAGQIQQVQQLQAQAGSAVAAASAAVDSAKAQLQPMLDQLSITQEQFDQILAQLSTTPEQFNQVLQKLSLAPEAIGQLIKQLEATPAQLEKLAADIRAEAVKAEPPIGTRASRVVHLFGAWLSVPLKLASDWLLFALALLVVTKLLGGRATLPKHLAAVALAAAPLVLLIGLYIPDMAGVMTVPMAGAIHYYARILALIALVWAGLIMLRTVSLAHEISVWRTFGAIVLTWVVLYVLVPLAGLFLTGYLLA